MSSNNNNLEKYIIKTAETLDYINNNLSYIERKYNIINNVINGTVYSVNLLYNIYPYYCIARIFI